MAGVLALARDEGALALLDCRAVLKSNRSYFSPESIRAARENNYLVEREGTVCVFDGLSATAGAATFFAFLVGEGLEEDDG